MRFDLGSAVQAVFRLVGLDVQRNQLLWKSDAVFLKLLAGISHHTLVTDDRCFMLYQLARATAHLPGTVAEVGVYRGGTAKLLARTCPRTTVHLFDTFSGLPSGTAGVDCLPAGDFSDTSLETVREYLLDCDNVVFHRGVFPESAQCLESTQFCFVHVDADLYMSIKSCLEFFYPRLSYGGIIVVDDYEWMECPGVKKAVDEFVETRSLAPIVARRYQCVLVKNHHEVDASSPVEAMTCVGATT